MPVPIVVEMLLKAEIERRAAGYEVRERKDATSP